MMMMIQVSALTTVLLMWSTTMWSVAGQEDDDAAETIALRAFKLCKETLKGEKSDDTVWHWTKYLCSDVQEAVEEYFSEMVRVASFHFFFLALAQPCADVTLRCTPPWQRRHVTASPWQREQ
jgi:hypothetical protein